MKRHLLAGVSLLAMMAAAPTVWATPCTSTFDYSGGIVDCTVSVTAGYRIVVYGAQGGGAGSQIGGKGAQAAGDFVLTANEQLKILVGGIGRPGLAGGGAGGGGGSFVIGPA